MYKRDAADVRQSGGTEHHAFNADGLHVFWQLIGFLLALAF